MVGLVKGMRSAMQGKWDGVLWVALAASWAAVAYMVGPHIISGVRYVRTAHQNAGPGAEAFNYLAQPVTLPDGRVVALGEVLRQMAVEHVKAAR